MEQGRDAERRSEGDAMAGSRIRGAVVIVEHGDIAVIEREKDGQRWYLLPGGGAEDGEGASAAAVREAREELGVEVELGRIVGRTAHARSDGVVSEQVYFRASIVGGRWGTGTGAEMALESGTDRGTYSPRWISLASIDDLDIRPRSLFLAVRDLGLDALEDAPSLVTD